MKTGTTDRFFLIRGAFIWLTLALSACASLQAETEVVWIDVRSAQEHAADTITGHLNIPHGSIQDAIQSAVPDKLTPINLYCRSGRRSGLAKTALEQLGYVNVANVGGIADARRVLTEVD